MGAAPPGSAGRGQARNHSVRGRSARQGQSPRQPERTGAFRPACQPDARCPCPPTHLFLRL